MRLLRLTSLLILIIGSTVAIGQTENDKQPRLTEGLKDSEINTRVLIDRVWLLEAGQEQPDWQGCIRAFGKAIARARGVYFDVHGRLPR